MPAICGILILCNAQNSFVVLSAFEAHRRRVIPRLPLIIEKSAQDKIWKLFLESSVIPRCPEE